MIVIADTSPLNYLVLIGKADLLQRLYRRVVIPEGVLRELLHPETSTIVSEWIARRQRARPLDHRGSQPRRQCGNP
jgi:predicted nucleic acid-binding protein